MERHYETLKDKMIANCIAIFILCCLTMNYILNVISSNMMYIGILFVMVVVLILNARYIDKTGVSHILLQWFLATIAVLLSTLRNHFDINGYVDAYVFLIFIAVLACCGNSSNTFDKSCKLIKVFAIYYAISVWVQIALPSVYSLFLKMIPDRNASIIRQLASTAQGFTGFTTNPGITAGYIVDGLILWVCAAFVTNKKKQIPLVLFMVITELFTGKRGHFLAFCVALCVLYIVSSYTKSQSITRFMKVVLIIAVLLTGLMVLGEALSLIPAVSRLYASMVGILNGDDITNNRMPLYNFAIQLFKENPWFGAGWGQYRVMTVGNVTHIRTIDTHNIYLQMLSEIGIIGLALLVIPMISSLRLTLRNLSYCSNGVVEEKWRFLLLFSLGYQVFFLVYGISGNPLYDHNCLIMYFFAILIAVSCKRDISRNHVSDFDQ